MTDETTPQAGGPDEENEAGTQPSVHALVQYVKDLSFENPNPVEALSNQDTAPEIAVNCQIGLLRLSEDTFEVSLHVDVKATREDKTVFLVELQYAGLFSLSNIPQEHLEPVLYIHCPTLLFPFVRQIVAEVTRNGGYPQLLLEMIDFAELFRQHQQAQAAQAANGQANGAATDDDGNGDGGDDGDGTGTA